LLRQLNDERPIRRLGVTRRALFEEIDRPNLNALPAEPHSVAEWRLRRVGVDYHVELDGHFYSVPYRFVRSEVEVRLTPRAVEVFFKGERIAAHLRASGNHRHTTVPEHMPSSHRRYADWNIERIRREAASIGRPRLHCASSSWSVGLAPNKASAPASASFDWRGHSVPTASKPPPPGRSRSAP
jgi:hypothetical protein